MLAAKTTAPVLGVPIPGPHLQGIDALHSIVQMPKGIPVAAFAIGEAGAANAALFAIAMLGRAFPALARQLDAFRQQQTEKACAMTLPPVSARAAQSEFKRLHVRISYAHPAHRLAGHTRRRPVRPHVLFCRAAAGISRLRVRSDPRCIAGAVADAHLCADYEDEAALVEFGQRCAAISTEFENIPAHCLEFLARLACVRPGAHCLAIAQDRAAEKRFIADCGVLVAPYRVIASVSALAALTPADLTAVLPGILKTARLGYDGKGQVHVKDADELRRAYAALGHVACIIEKQLPIADEISALIARGADGATAMYPLAHNMHRNGILARTLAPAPIPSALAEQAAHAARAIAEQLDYVGMLCVEFFILRDGALFVNEIAPRPHNSGHYTIDACVTSQFVQQVRALTGLPLGEARQHSAAVMLNLLGDLWFVEGAEQTPPWHVATALPGAHLHLYAKPQARIGRKMGHLTCTAATLDHALENARRAAQQLGISPF